MKKILLIILSIYILNLTYLVTFAEEKTSPFSTHEGYKLYQERVKTICNKYTKDSEGNKIKYFIEIEDYIKIQSITEILEQAHQDILKENPNLKELTLKNRIELRKKLKEKTTESQNLYNFDKIKNTHRNNMNNIYKCAMLYVKKESYISIKEYLIKDNASIKKKIEDKMEKEIIKIEKFIESLKCNKSNKENINQKSIILKQATYQTCKYVSYLEYAKEYNKELANLLLLEEDREKYRISDAIDREREKISEIDNEIEHVYRIFPIVFQAYTEYESNISIHLLLELIKEDYKVFRDKFHEVINPINQVVYKISNAMKK